MTTMRESLRWLRKEDIEKCFANLATGFAIGALSSYEFAAAMKVFKFRDDGNHYWSIGAASGEWYMHDGVRWRKAQPPDEMLGPDLPLVPVRTAETTREPAAPSRRAPVAPSAPPPRHAAPPPRQAAPPSPPEPPRPAPPRPEEPPRAAASRPDPLPERGRPRFCADCGAPVTAGKRFCTRCGASVG